MATPQSKFRHQSSVAAHSTDNRSILKYYVNTIKSFDVHLSHFINWSPATSTI